MSEILMATNTILGERIPEDVAGRCLARLPLSSIYRLRCVSTSWRSALLSHHLFHLRAVEHLTQPWLYVATHGPLWQAYDPLSRRWRSLPPLPSSIPSLSKFAMVAAGQSVFVLGGQSEFVNPATGEFDESLSSEVWAWDGRKGQWEQKSSMPFARTRFSCCVIGGKIVVAGGLASVGDKILPLQPSTSVVIYDPEEDRWSSGPELRACSGAFRGVVLGDKLHVLHPKQRIAEVLDLSQNEWTVMECHLGDHTMTQVNGELYTLHSGRLLRDGKTVAYAPQLDRVAEGIAAIGSDIYVFGGFICRNILYSDGLNDCSVISLADRVVSEAPRMTVCSGTVLGSVVLSL